MLLLLDTSTRTAVAALADASGEKIVGERTYPASEGGSSLLLAGARELLTAAGADLRALRGLIVNRGPGSYTGLRVGYAIAQGLAESRGLAIAGIPSFQALAAEYRDGNSAFVVCFDARSRGIAWITYQAGEEGPQLAGERGAGAATGLDEVLALGEERIGVRMAPAEAVPGLISRPCRIAGPGVNALLEQLEDPLPENLEAIEGSDRPSPAVLARLGAQALQSGGEDPTAVEPLYLGTIAPPKTPAAR